MTIGLREPPCAHELLTEYQKTGCEQPFEEVMRRYAGMVFNVCYRVTKSTHDAEDATQAVFLALAAQLKTGVPIQYVGAWLQQVAHRISLDIRRGKKRRAARELVHGEITLVNHNGNPQRSGADLEELKGIVAESLQKLPTKYRLPLILHFFGGMSREEMAKELNCKPSTLGVRLHRAKAMLGKLLTRRGVDLTGMAMVVTLGQIIRSAVTESIVAHATQTAATLGAASAASSALAPYSGEFARTATLAAKAKLAFGAALVAGTALTAGAQAMGLVHISAIRQRLPEEIDSIVQSLKRPLMRTVIPSPVASATNRPAPHNNVSSASLMVSETPAPGRGMARGQAPGIAPQSARTIASASAATPSNLPLSPATSRVENATNAAIAPPGRAVISYAKPAIAWDDLPASVARATPSARNAPAAPTPAAASPGTNGASTVVDSIQASAAPDDLYIGGGGGGGGPFIADAGLISAAHFPAPQRNYTLSGGVLAARVEHIGSAGRGTFTQTGGVNAADAVRLGSQPGDAGTYVLSDGTLQIMSEQARNHLVKPVLQIGGAGAGKFQFGNALSTGTISEIPPGSGVSLQVRSDAHGSGAFVGWGTVQLTGSLVQNGKIVADGYGKDRTLDLSSLGSAVASDLAIVHTIPNGPNGTDGWYAQAGGKLTLPPLQVSAGAGAYTWGEPSADTTPDLVNSVRAVVSDAPKTQSVSISLLSPQRADVPPLPAGTAALGLWNIQPPGALGDADFTIRYDQTAAAALSATPCSLQVWEYDGTWQQLTTAVSVDGNQHLIGGMTSDAQYLYVAASYDLTPAGIPESTFVNMVSATTSVPEPAALAAVSVSSLLLLRRRRRVP